MEVEIFSRKLFMECATFEVFGKGCDQYLGMTTSEKYKAEKSFSSIAFFADILYKNSVTDELVTKPVIVKIVREKGFSSWNNVHDFLFSNETSIYRKILPFFANIKPSIANLVPEFYYSSYSAAAGQEISGIILENLFPKKFRSSNNNVFMDMKHLTLMIKNLAKFHACSYAARNENKAAFMQIVRSFREVNPTVNEQNPGFIEHQLERGLKPLRDNPSYKGRLRGVEQMVKDIVGYLGKAFSRQTNTAVVNHGDFSRSNVFFRYSENGEPIDVKFFDFGNARYCSPTTDLSWFLYANTDQKTRDEHWDTLIDVYYNTLASTFPRNQFVPSKAEILNDFEHTAAVGYYYSSFMLPALLEEESNPNFKFSDQVAKIESRYPDKISEKLTDLCLAAGGDEGTKVLTDILKDIIDRGFLQM